MHVVVLGTGYAGEAVARLARSRGEPVTATTRDPERAAALQKRGYSPLLAPALEASFLEPHVREAHVVVCFPPDGETDARIAPALRGANAITYLSTTGVYGDSTGHIDDETPLPPPDAHSAGRLAAEAVYRELGACTLRCPGIYGPDRGLHCRVIRGQHRIAGDGSRTLSRIHVEDLAALALASRAFPGETFVVGDLEPAPHAEVVRFICESYRVPYPGSEPLETAHRTLRANRRIDGRRALRMLGVTLRYPSYREGMAPAATGMVTAEIARCVVTKG